MWQTRGRHVADRWQTGWQAGWQMYRRTSDGGLSSSREGARVTESWLGGFCVVLPVLLEQHLGRPLHPCIAGPPPLLAACLA